MKKSYYNFIVNVDNDTTLAYNSFTTDLSIVDERFSFILENLEKLEVDALEPENMELYRVH